MPAGRGIDGIPVTEGRSVQARYAPGLLAAGYIAAALAAGPAWADSPIPTYPADGTVTAEQIDSAIAAVEAREGLDQDTRTKVIDQLRDAQVLLQNAQSARESAATFVESIKTAPVETQKLRKQLDEDSPAAPTAESMGIGDSTQLSDLEQQVATKLAEIAAAEAKLAELDTQITTQTSWRRQSSRSRPRANRQCSRTRANCLDNSSWTPARRSSTASTRRSSATALA